MNNINVCYENLVNFVEKEKIFFNSLPINDTWDAVQWNTKEWLFHRGSNHYINFNLYKFKTRVLDSKMPKDFGDFTKALAIYLYRSKKIGFMAIRNYVIACRQLSVVLKNRNEVSPVQLTKWHFDQVIDDLKENKFKKIYEAAANLKVVADLLDKLDITPLAINYINCEKNNHYYHDYKSLSELNSEDDRIGKEKLPSYEAMVAYAICTNKPINNDEKILLRTIDLLIAMGQRANEVTYIPYDCWVEIEKKDENGKIILDAKKKPIKDVGIRYYAEKKFESRVHWLAEQDVQFAYRAVNDLKVLTEEVRKVAKFQEQYNRMWKYDKDEIISDVRLLQYLGFQNTYNLSLYLKRNNIPIHSIDKKIKHPINNSGKRICQHYYLAGDIENLFFKKYESNIILKDNNKVILRVGDLLSIKFEGAFRFKRKANTFRVVPCKLTLEDINAALGSGSKTESIFERRGLKEADGSKIKITSHQPRHWRNTLYELAGMSNINQALALGRQLIDQNTVYKHLTVKETTQVHKDFITFNSVAEKINFLRTGIRDKTIIGDLTDTYHKLKQSQGLVIAEEFISTHTNALHITPFGACSNDFSLSPCPKHLQCWNGCTNLNLTGSKHEIDNLNKLIDSTEKALEQMKNQGEGDFGSDIWILDIEKKLSNMKFVQQLANKGIKHPLFPNGIDFSNTNKKTDLINGKK